MSRHMFLGQELLITGDIPTIYPALAALGVTLSPQTLAVGASEGTVILLNPWTGETADVDVDSVILCMGKVPVTNLYREMRKRGDRPVHRVGDCVAPRHVEEAIFEGERAGRAIGGSLSPAGPAKAASPVAAGA